MKNVLLNILKAIIIVFGVLALIRILITLLVVVLGFSTTVILTMIGYWGIWLFGFGMLIWFVYKKITGR